MNKILIVDDKPENLYLLQSLLEGSGYRAIRARNGAEAFGLVKTEIPDLIISDVLMPIMDGFTFCRECKKDDKLKKIPFIFYTATYTDPKDEEFALSLGADRFLIKPMEPDLFLETIKQILGSIDKNGIILREPAITEETIVLKQYNEALVRKLEDKMRQTEENEKQLKRYIKELEDNIEARKRGMSQV